MQTEFVDKFYYFIYFGGESTFLPFEILVVPSVERVGGILPYAESVSVKRSKSALSVFLFSDFLFLFISLPVYFNFVNGNIENIMGYVNRK